MTKFIVRRIRSLLLLSFFIFSTGQEAFSESVVYQVDSTRSFLSLTEINIQGVAFSPQFTGSDIASLTGQINAERTASTIEFTPSNIRCNNSGTYSPGVGGSATSAPGNWAYAFTAQAPGKLVYREIAISLDSDPIPTAQFNATLVTMVGISGYSDMRIGNSGSRDSAVPGTAPNGKSGGSVNTANGVETLTIPIDIIDTYPGVYYSRFIGHIVATRQLPPSLRADFDADGDVDGSDFLTWQRNMGLTSGATRAMGDADLDGDVDSADLTIYRFEFGTTIIPDILPSSLVQPVKEKRR